MQQVFGFKVALIINAKYPVLSFSFLNAFVYGIGKNTWSRQLMNIV